MNELVSAYEDLIALLVCEIAASSSIRPLEKFVDARARVDEIKERMLDDHK